VPTRSLSRRGNACRPRQISGRKRPESGPESDLPLSKAAKCGREQIAIRNWPLFVTRAPRKRPRAVSHVCVTPGHVRGRIVAGCGQPRTATERRAAIRHEREQILLAALSRYARSLRDPPAFLCVAPWDDPPAHPSAHQPLRTLGHLHSAVSPRFSRIHSTLAFV
jgi:hypothetical protein